MKFTRLLGFLCMALCWSTPGLALDGRTLPAVHAQGGVTCHDCHQTLEPKGPATADGCMNCHGDGPAVAELTAKLKVNPHQPPKAPHVPLNACPDCHRQHQPATVTCMKCHPTFTFHAK